MVKFNVQVSEKAQAYAVAEAAKRGLPDASAYVSALLEEAASKNGGAEDGSDFEPLQFFRPRTIDEIIAEQGVSPATDVSSLYGDFWPEEEHLDDFLSTLKEWRRGVKPTGCE